MKSRVDRFLDLLEALVKAVEKLDNPRYVYQFPPAEQVKPMPVVNGYTCPNCGAWVPNNITHTCNQFWTTNTNLDHYYIDKPKSSG